MEEEEVQHRGVDCGSEYELWGARSIDPSLL